jgi:hypothetical protein
MSLLMLSYAKLRKSLTRVWMEMGRSVTNWFGSQLLGRDEPMQAT